MDILCTKCGERWNLDHVLHEQPDGFERDGGLITKCPACRSGRPQLSSADRERLQLAAELARLLGDDMDALACELADLDLV